MNLDGYWVATAAGVWRVVNLDDPLEPIAMLIPVPPVAPARCRPAATMPAPARRPRRRRRRVLAAREVHEITPTPDGAWCHRVLSDPGGGAEASYQTWCIDGDGLRSGDAGDGHGATTWESSFTRP